MQGALASQQAAQNSFLQYNPSSRPLTAPNYVMSPGTAAAAAAAAPPGHVALSYQPSSECALPLQTVTTRRIGQSQVCM